MKLKDVINEYNIPNNTAIMYRTYGPNKEDIFAGYCTYSDGELIPEDGDSYSLEDEITDYSLEYDNDGNIYLIVWYKSGWIC